jgi:hypothetical protein
MAIVNSYVKLPDGTHIFVDFPFESPGFFFRASQTSPGSKVSGQLETS